MTALCPFVRPFGAPFRVVGRVERRKGQCGFTLIEVLAAMAVFALIAVLSIGVLRAAIDGRERLDAHADRLNALQQARNVLRQDLAQLVLRPVRGEFGGQSPISFSGGQALEGEALLRLVRRGWENPGGLQRRSNLQHVTYLIEDRRLIRRSRPLLDPAPGLPETDRVLLRDIRLVDLRFFGQGRWQARWQAGPPPNARLPQAVELTLELPRLGAVRNAFLAGP